MKKELWEMTIDESIQQNKKRIMDSGIEKNEIDKNQIALWKRTFIRTISNLPRDTNISLKTLKSLPEKTREYLLKTHSKAALNWPGKLS